MCGCVFLRLRVYFSCHVFFPLYSILMFEYIQKLENIANLLRKCLQPCWFFRTIKIIQNFYQILFSGTITSKESPKKQNGFSILIFKLSPMIHL